MDICPNQVRMTLMPSTRRSRTSGHHALAHVALLFAACLALALLSLTVLGGARSQAKPPNPPHGDGVHPGGGNGGLDNSGHGLHQLPPPPPPPEDPPDKPPPDDPPPNKEPANNPGPPSSTPTGSGISGVAGVSASGHSSSDSNTGHPAAGDVIVKPHPKPDIASKHKAKEAKPVKALEAGPSPAPAAAPTGNPNRSTFADRLLSPTEIDLSAKNLAQGGLLALLLAALLYLPVTIFNKATEKNHETIKRWFSGPRAVLLFLFGWIPFRKHPAITLTIGVIASAFLFSFIEPGFPAEDGAVQYLIGMVLGFGVVSFVFFATWRLVLRRLEPDGTGEWKLYPPFILLAAFLVLMARLAHFLPGVVLGTVAEYEPDRKLSVRTAGIRVAVTYGALMILGIGAWFAWIPVEHAAAHEHASNLTLILDAALAITFVSALESVAFGLIPMTFLDGNDLFTWRKGLWAAMWGGALLWFTVVIMHPALSTYGHHAERASVFWFVLLFSSLMVAALATWGFFRLRDARIARAAEGSA
jgi:hypothetical protein